MKRMIVLMMAMLMVFALAACSSTGGADNEEPAGSAQEAAEPSQDVQTDEAAPEDAADAEALQDAFKEKIGGSGLTFYKSVPNDVTGNWRVAVIYTDADMVENALDYYKAYFGSDDEIHFICNLGLKTTTSIKVLAGQLYVDVFEYVDGEEHDAKTLPGGDLLKSYTVDMTTGEATELAE